MNKKLINNNVVDYPFSSYRMAWTYIKSDYIRYNNSEISFWGFLQTKFQCRGFHYSVWMRLSGVKGFFQPLCRLRLHQLSSKYGIQIQPETKIGMGLYIGHGIGIVCSPTAVIGKNVNLSQFTTIGTNKGKAATIGDNVYIGPNVCLVEDVVIGNNAVIGAGAVVIKDVPSNATAVGVPARNIIKTR